ncbi:hypothetical protein Focb16_v005401 [Fusarium oxysporum f. sp. cubense]|uniref:Uncharacterized protein n=1 Tax=Fusarium oxysporum f. sp. cubense TaxID=61366 RepID=A0A559LHV4_FUSOC|nr:hypothetical protein Focb16_v005401 [Fusarium oxysporum f. sp. cubense]
MSQDTQAELRNAMYWDEDGERCFHSESYNFGKSLIPLLKPESTITALIEMMKSYERLRSFRENVMTPVYANRVKFVNTLFNKESYQHYLQLFNNPQEVRQLVCKQNDAHVAGMLVTPGWRKKMQDAGILVYILMFLFH